MAADRLFKGGVSGHERYAVSSGNQIPLRGLVELYGCVVSKELPIMWAARPYRLREVMVPWSEGVQVPGWHPRTGLYEGICAACRSVGEQVKPAPSG